MDRSTRALSTCSQPDLDDLGALRPELEAHDMPFSDWSEIAVWTSVPQCLRPTLEHRPTPRKPGSALRSRSSESPA